MFNVLVYSFLAVLLVVAGITVVTRNRHHQYGEDVSPTPTGHPSAGHPHHPDSAERRNRKARRAQSRNARRKRH